MGLHPEVWPVPGNGSTSVWLVNFLKTGPGTKCGCTNLNSNHLGGEINMQKAATMTKATWMIHVWCQLLRLLSDTHSLFGETRQSWINSLYFLFTYIHLLISIHSAKRVVHKTLEMLQNTRKWHFDLICSIRCWHCSSFGSDFSWICFPPDDKR